MRWALSLVRARRHDAAPRLVIVRHHRIYDDTARPLYRLGVARSVFEAQLDTLVGAGLTPVTVAEGLAGLSAGRPGTRVALSFDDGYADNVTLALPALVARGARASFYLTAGWIESRATPWWDVLAGMLARTRQPRLVWAAPDGTLDLPLDRPDCRTRALQALLPRLRLNPEHQAERLASLAHALGEPAEAACELATWQQCAALGAAGMETGAHTLHHPFLSLLSPEQQRAEIEGSIERIDQRLGVRPRGLAYPAGDHDATTVAVARAAGLAYAVTTRTGDNATGAEPFTLHRRGLSEGACLGPGGRFSRRLALAELEGAFDRLRGNTAEAAA